MRRCSSIWVYRELKEIWINKATTQKSILQQAKHDQNNQLAHKVWNRIEVYLATGVLLFADVFEIFRNKCLEYYKLDPAHFYIKSGLARQTLLKITSEYWEYEARDKDCALYLDELKLELLRDVEMLLAFEKDIWEELGWQFTVVVKSNNKYMKE